jgi:hypothetical protein
MITKLYERYDSTLGVGNIPAFAWGVTESKLSEQPLSVTRIQRVICRRIYGDVGHGQQKENRCPYANVCQHTDIIS